MTDTPIKKTVQIDLEVAPTQAGTSKFQTLIELAKVVDSWRIFPRAFISMYIWVVVETMKWFWALESATTQQSSVIGVVLGVGAAWFAAYVATGKK